MGFDFYWYYPFYILFLGFAILVYHQINVKLLFILALLLIYSLVTYEHGLTLIGKQFLNILFSTLVFYNLIVHERYGIIEIFRKYVVLAKIVLVLGFAQVVFFYLGYGEMYVSIFPWLGYSNIGVRLQSVSQEPSYIALTFAPVIFYSLHNLFYKTSYFLNKMWSGLFMAGYLLTFSSLAYLSILIILIVLYFKKFTSVKLILIGFVALGLFLLSFIMYRNIPFVKIRIDDTAFAITKDFTDPDIFRAVNFSTYALLSNLYVTKESLAVEPITGHGLGTHELTYRKYLPLELQNYRILNAEDANSMALRLLTETGLLGFTIFLFFTIHYRIRYNGSFPARQKLLWVINCGIFIVILLSLIRNGNYTVHGKILFFLAYYYTYRMLRKETQRALDPKSIQHAGQ